ncbi:alpha/beta hydrolase [Gordonia liuliyuniae]|uniref:Alpha/beta-hydrolase family protein n=1 Tax=Gordonia liuliyuniae TaxID=2911517 RepID=A0ABS9IQC8_9ACTN|nr:alpha/beta-hydrolase family protein [Gordonia liuliyuniae]MCF8587758.1 alpha/beta-hydrolase family protein [Gordonia liuliyuniae]
MTSVLTRTLTGGDVPVDTQAVPDGPDPIEAGPGETDTVEAGAGRSRVARWAVTYGSRLSFTGAVIATVFLWLSATPSLLPRGPLFQGVVSAGAAAVGYMIGVFFAWLARYLVSRTEPWPRPRRIAWVALGAIAAIGTAVMLYWYARWQDELRDLMGVARLSWGAYPQILVIALVAFALLIAVGQAWGALVRMLTRRLSRHVPPRISAAVSVAVVVVLSMVFVNDVVAKNTMQLLNSTFAAVNEESTPDSEPPTSPLRSGSPESLASWESLGRMGRAFVSTGPSREEISEFNGSPAEEPIRVYSGIESARDITAAADLAARELVRAGGLDRKVIGVASTTGTGWINRANPDSLEYMYNGDTAMVSMQYSTLPSWLSFLVDQERAREAGRALFEAVDEVVRRLPEAERPKVVVFGESLGSFAGESPFGSIPTMAARTDGVLLTGPTFSNTLWRDTTDDRDDGSPEYLPVVDDGERVRFISDASDLDEPAGLPWASPRIVYLQHASDPISWWSPDLILSEPDWLDEQRGPDVLAATRWIPFVTFLQVAADMAVSVDVPDGHGHNYLAAIPKAWTKILQPDGWTDADTDRLLPRLSRD